MSFWIAMAGLVVTLLGRWQKQPNWKQQHGYFWGAALLFSSAVIDQEPLIISFEAVILIGTGLAFLPLTHRWKSVITIGGGLVALCALYGVDTAITWQIMLGMIGLAIGATGFAIINDKIQLTSSAIMTVYNGMNVVVGIPSAFPFTVLNLVFSLLALRAIKQTSQKGQNPNA